MDKLGRVRTHYNSHPETDRFDSARGLLEFERTKAILQRHLQQTPLDILDVGGGTGVYSFWLATLGHRVSLVDLSDVHVTATRAKNASASRRLVSITQGSAMDLPNVDRSFDLVLNMGPMYHLSPEQRHSALQECRRVLRDAGLLVSAYISRFAALMDGYSKGYILDPAYEPLALGDIVHGTHDSPDDDKYFTLAYMHRPEEIEPELIASGFHALEVCAVEGLFWTYPHLGQFLSEPQGLQAVLKHAELIEKEPSVMGASAHLLAVARKTPT